MDPSKNVYRLPATPESVEVQPTGQNRDRTPLGPETIEHKYLGTVLESRSGFPAVAPPAQRPFWGPARGEEQVRIGNPPAQKRTSQLFRILSIQFTYQKEDNKTLIDKRRPSDHFSSSGWQRDQTPAIRSLTPVLNTNRTTYMPVYLHQEHPSGVP